MNVLGASSSKQGDFMPVEGTMFVQPEFEQNIYLESVLPSEADQPFSFQAANPKIIRGQTIDGFLKLPSNPLVSANNTDATFSPQYDYLRR
jgi:hypothetical protein|tara:strand:- start:363 stop:635 length:273 start_codon:yes stop_codon:yes gene_type:complete